MGVGVTNIRNKLANELLLVMHNRLGNNDVMPTTEELAEMAIANLAFEIHADKPLGEALRLLRDRLKQLVTKGYKPEMKILKYHDFFMI